MTTVTENETLVVREEQTRYYPDGITVSGTWEVSGTAIVGASAPDMRGKSRADGEKNLIAAADGEKNLIAAADGEKNLITVADGRID